MLIHNPRRWAAIFVVLVLSLGTPFHTASPQEQPAAGTAAPQNESVAGAERSSARAPGPGATPQNPSLSPEARDELEERLTEMYGAVLVAGGGAVPPPGILFADEASVAAWQAGVPTERATIGKVTIELQVPAMQALLDARAEAKKIRRNITVRSRTSARRKYADTVRFWQARVDAGLAYWQKKGSITRAQARRIRALTPIAQVPEILRLEADGLFFSSNLKKSILASAAAPGASQHLSMLALDVTQHEQPKVCAILAKHGWYQTVPGDLPHFTFLGAREEDLPTLGLKKITLDKRDYWILDRAH